MELTIKDLEEKQVQALEDYENGIHGWPELQTMLQLLWERIQKLRQNTYMENLYD